EGKSEAELLRIVVDKYHKARSTETWHVYYGQGIGTSDFNHIRWCDVQAIAAIELLDNEALTNPILERINAEIEKEYPKYREDGAIDTDITATVLKLSSKNVNAVIVWLFADMSDTRGTRYVHREVIERLKDSFTAEENRRIESVMAMLHPK